MCAFACVCVCAYACARVYAYIFLSHQLRQLSGQTVPKRVKIVEVGPRDGLQNEKVWEDVEAMYSIILYQMRHRCRKCNHYIQHIFANMICSFSSINLNDFRGGDRGGPGGLDPPPTLSVLLHPRK